MSKNKDPGTKTDTEDPRKQEERSMPLPVPPMRRVLSPVVTRVKTRGVNSSNEKELGESQEDEWHIKVRELNVLVHIFCFKRIKIITNCIKCNGHMFKWLIYIFTCIRYKTASYLQTLQVLPYCRRDYVPLSCQRFTIMTKMLQILDTKVGFTRSSWNIVVCCVPNRK